MALGGDLSSAYPMSRRQPCMRGRERPMARCGELGLTRPPGRRDAVHGGGAGFQVRLVGKGRPCPLWPQTAQLHSRLLRGAATRSPLGPARLRRPRRNPAHALRSPLPPRQDLGRAKESAPTLAHKRLHPHTLRHSTAVHLQKAGVDPPIRSWLSQREPQHDERVRQRRLRHEAGGATRQTARQSTACSGRLVAVEGSLTRPAVMWGPCGRTARSPLPRARLFIIASYFGLEPLGPRRSTRPSKGVRGSVWYRRRNHSQSTRPEGLARRHWRRDRDRRDLRSPRAWSAPDRTDGRVPPERHGTRKASEVKHPSVATLRGVRLAQHGRSASAGARARLGRNTHLFPASP